MGRTAPPGTGSQLQAMTGIVPRQEFDEWAESYDGSIAIDQFPFWGYQEVLAKVVDLAKVRAGMSVLDLGTGTGNLAVCFATSGCELWCTDFSAPMLARARQKLPNAHFHLHDLSTDLPVALQRSFDRIVSAYVFHHFEQEEKIRILRGLLPWLAPGGRMLIGDISFQDQAALEKVRAVVGGDWEEEFYWLADDSLIAMEKAGVSAKYIQVSPCAGIFTLNIDI
jgi:putative AdoMet-dependent methyltransferase